MILGSALLGLAPSRIRGGAGVEGLCEGGGQGGGRVAAVVSGQGELSSQLEVVVLDGLVAGFETGRPAALLHLGHNHHSYTLIHAGKRQVDWTGSDQVWGF